MVCLGFWPLRQWHLPPSPSTPCAHESLVRCGEGALLMRPRTAAESGLLMRLLERPTGTNASGEVAPVGIPQGPSFPHGGLLGSQRLPGPHGPARRSRDSEQGCDARLDGPSVRTIRGNGRMADSVDSSRGARCPRPPRRCGLWNRRPDHLAPLEPEVIQRSS